MNTRPMSVVQHLRVADQIWLSVAQQALLVLLLFLVSVCPWTTSCVNEGSGFRKLIESYICGSVIVVATALFQGRDSPLITNLKRSSESKCLSAQTHVLEAVARKKAADVDTKTTGYMRTLFPSSSSNLLPVELAPS